MLQLITSVRVHEYTYQYTEYYIIILDNDMLSVKFLCYKCYHMLYYIALPFNLFMMFLLCRRVRVMDH